MRKKSAKGFSLAELLVVIGILLAVSISVILALKPDKRARDARNLRRAQDAATIIEAIQMAIAENTIENTPNAGIFNADYPAILFNNFDNWSPINPFSKPPLSETQIGTGTGSNNSGDGTNGTCDDKPAPSGSGCTFAPGRGCIDLANGTQGPLGQNYISEALSKHLKSNPIDPASGWDAVRTGYTIAIDVNDIITIRNCNTETGNDPPNTYKPFSISR